MTLLIQNGRFFDGTDFSQRDVLVRDGVVEQIAAEISVKADRVFDASGMTVLPGLVDVHMHMEGVSSPDWSIDPEQGCFPFGVTAAVDAVPLLGSGTVLLPWALVSFLSGAPVRAVGLLGIYATALLTRSSLEPRLLGRQLGLDPLAALMARYAGYRIWGFGGMILAPILTVTAKELCRGNS